MNKQDLIVKISAEAGISQAQARTALKSFENGVADALSKGDSVRMTGFGTFTSAKREERTGRNPKTGEPLTIMAKTVAKFKAGVDLDNAVNSK